MTYRYDRGVHPCTCGEILYAEKVKHEFAIVIRHGENPECVKVFSVDDPQIEERMADWYEEVHSGLQKEGGGKEVV